MKVKLENRRKAMAKKIANELGVSKNEALKIMRVVFVTVADELKTHRRVYVSEIGNFFVKFRKPRMFVNPKTGARQQGNGKRYLEARISGELNHRIEGEE